MKYNSLLVETMNANRTKWEEAKLLIASKKFLLRWVRSMSMLLFGFVIGSYALRVYDEESMLFFAIITMIFAFSFALAGIFTIPDFLRVFNEDVTQVEIFKKVLKIMEKEFEDVRNRKYN